MTRSILLLLVIVGPEVTKIVEAEGECVDKKRCEEYENPCREPFLDWARKYCRKYCNFCIDENGTIGSVTDKVLKPSGQGNTDVIVKPKRKESSNRVSGSSKCKTANGVIDNGERSTDKNSCQHICEDGMLIPDNFGCKFRGKCYRPDETWTYGCSEYRCEINYEPITVKYDAKLTKNNEGCQVDGSDICYGNGERWKTDCIEYSCVVTVKQQENVTRNQTQGQKDVKNDVVIVDRECRDYYGNCRKPGEKFTFKCFGKRCHNCSCELIDGKISYSCPIQVT